eukprot:11352527-Alexandrium_andersonii.AAC.1
MHFGNERLLREGGDGLLDSVKVPPHVPGCEMTGQIRSAMTAKRCASHTNANAACRAIAWVPKV